MHRKEIRNSGINRAFQMNTVFSFSQSLSLVYTDILSLLYFETEFQIKINFSSVRKMVSAIIFSFPVSHFERTQRQARERIHCHRSFYASACCIYFLYLLFARKQNMHEWKLTKSVTASCVCVCFFCSTKQTKRIHFSIQSVARSNNSRHKLKNGRNTNVKRLKAVQK